LNRLGEVTDSPSAWDALGHFDGNVAYDIGANIGQAARLLAPHFKRVVCFEPCLESYGVLGQEHPDNVEVWPLAVSDHVGKVKLDEAEVATSFGQLVNGAVAMGHSEWGKKTGHRLVPCTTVDEWVRQGGYLPDLIKVDTEGHEPRVLAGARHTIGLGRSIWFLELHAAAHWSAVRPAFRYYDLERIEHDYLVGHPRAEDHFYAVARPRRQ
jgi:FkbM family methyltransferase